MSFDSAGSIGSVGISIVNGRGWNAAELAQQATDKIIYIGDGHSDICPSRCADLVFAKDVLLQTCEEEGTANYRPFHDFGEISRYLKENF